MSIGVLQRRLRGRREGGGLRWEASVVQHFRERRRGDDPFRVALNRQLVRRLQARQHRSAQYSKLQLQLSSHQATLTSQSLRQSLRQSLLN